MMGILAPAAVDVAFFEQHPKRMFHIRVACRHEYETEFRSLGPHERSRRRVIVARASGMMAKAMGVRLMPIPFLAFADETIEDDDATLRPIYDEIMRAARLEHGL
jgi:hypothetical protein